MMPDYNGARGVVQDRRVTENAVRDLGHMAISNPTVELTRPVFGTRNRLAETWLR